MAFGGKLLEEFNLCSQVTKCPSLWMQITGPVSAMTLNPSTTTAEPSDTTRLRDSTCRFAGLQCCFSVCYGKPYEN